MKSFVEYIEEQSDNPVKSKGAMTRWITHHVLNTDTPHDEIKNKFIDRYGAGNVEHFDKVVSDLVD